MVGALMLPACSRPNLGSDTASMSAISNGMYSGRRPAITAFTATLAGVAATVAWSGGVTFGLVRLVEATMGLRVSEEEERIGLDEVLHGESLG